MPRCYIGYMALNRNGYPDKILNAFKQVSIVVLLGARQVGKTSIMEGFSQDRQVLTLYGQDPETAQLFEKLSQLEKYLQVYLNPQLKGYLLVDEFQYIPGVSTMMKLLTDKHRNLKILCSGSSALDILQQVEESLAGRVRTLEVLSLSFSEYLFFNDPKLAALYETLDMDTGSSPLTAPIEALLSEYLVYGGLPRAALTADREEKIQILDDIYQTYLLKDIRNYISQGDIVGFNKMLRLISAQIGNLLNVNEVSLASGLPRRTCEEYLYILEQMGIIKLLEPYFVNRRKAIGKMKKVYFCDLGLRNLIEKNFNDIEYRPDRGALFENFCMLELWRNRGAAGELQFYRTSDGAEVDFILNRLSKKTAVECKFSAFAKPVSLAAFNHFCDDEAIVNRFILNRTLNTVYRDARFLPGFLADRI
ncbi:ATPase [Spirochaetia bacterium]|nr:ATPase [Spirochaetia bacterium]